MMTCPVRNATIAGSSAAAFKRSPLGAASPAGQAPPRGAPRPGNLVLGGTAAGLLTCPRIVIRCGIPDGLAGSVYRPKHTLRIRILA